MAVRINPVDVCVTCPEGHVNRIPMLDWYQHDPDVNQKSDDQMGSEVCHRFTLDRVPCSDPQCDCTLDAEIEVWEYPVGMENSRGQSDNVDSADAVAAVSIEVE